MCCTVLEVFLVCFFVSPLIGDMGIIIRRALSLAPTLTCTVTTIHTPSHKYIYIHTFTHLHRHTNDPPSPPHHFTLTYSCTCTQTYAYAHTRARTHRHPHPYQCGELPFWQVIFLFLFFVLFFCLTESCLFVVYSFHSPQVLLEFCGFMQLSAVSFFSEFSSVLWSTVFQLGIL